MALKIVYPLATVRRQKIQLKRGRLLCTPGLTHKASLSHKAVEMRWLLAYTHTIMNDNTMSYTAASYTARYSCSTVRY